MLIPPLWSLILDPREEAQFRSWSRFRRWRAAI